MRYWTLVLITSLGAAGFGQMPAGYPTGKWREPRALPSPVGPGSGIHDTGLVTVMIDDVGGQEAWRNTFLWPDTAGMDHLYWNWLAVGLDWENTVDGWDMDWRTTPGGQLTILEPGQHADEEGLAEYEDAFGRARVRQHSFAWGSATDADYVIVAYAVVNTSDSLQDSVFVSHRTDFDVLGDHGGATTDLSGFDSARTLAYMWDTSSAWCAGLRLLKGRFCAYHTGWWTGEETKYEVMSTAGIDSTTPYPDDWCFWLSAGPYQIAAGDSFDVAYAFLMGEDLAELQTNADRALDRWRQLSVLEARPGRARNFAPATIYGGTVFLAGTPRSRLSDATGREVAELHPGPNDVSRLAPGVYFLRTAQNLVIRKVIIAK